MAYVTKANGILEKYDQNKVLKSIANTGLPAGMQQDVLDHVNKNIYDNIPTKQIYGHIIEFLGTSSYPYAKSSYSLKQAIMDLGPTGYPFEDFIAQILISLGFQTSTRQTIKGKCITHEVDIIAKKDNEIYMVEAKFHNSVGIHTDVHVPMYTKSRFDDLSQLNGFTKAWIITNTKATSDAIAFAECTNMLITSWSYPENSSLRELIQRAGLHPLTILNTLSQAQKIELLNKHIVRCKDVHENPGILHELSLSEKQQQDVLNEIAFVCRGEHK